MQFLIQGIEAELVPSEFPEDLDFAEFPNFSDFVEETALQKIEEVYARMLQAQKAGDNIQMPDVMIAADTMVTLEGEMYGKPQDEQHAIEMLTKCVKLIFIVYFAFRGTWFPNLLIFTAFFLYCVKIGVCGNLSGSFQICKILISFFFYFRDFTY